MNYENPLDHTIHRFQHRWETDRQFRAAMSGVFGLLLIVVLCAGVSTLDMAATRVLAAVGINAAAPNAPSQINKDTGLVITGNQPINTPTVPTWSVPIIPQASPLASSGTPAPSPTPSPTPTDVPTHGTCTSNCGGAPTVVVTAYTIPSNWKTGLPATIYFHTASAKDGSVVPNDGINAFIHWSNGAQWLSASDSCAAKATDANGNGTWVLDSTRVIGGAPCKDVPSDGRCSGTVKVDFSANDHGTPVYGAALTISCTKNY
jgi:hypothetical protein